MRRRTRFLAAILFACAATATQAAPTVLHGLAMGESASVRGLLPAGAKGAGQAVRLQRMAIYADDADLAWIDEGRPREAQRSQRRWFVGEGPGPHDRVMVSFDPADGRVRGARFHDGGGEDFEGRIEGDRLLIASRRDIASLPGSFQCGGAPVAAPLPDHGARARPEAGAKGGEGAKGGGTLVATLAIDTDVELLSSKFSNNTVNASDWIADLVALINVIYARDLGFEFRIGKQILRTGAAGSDPYDTPVGTSTTDQLYEFGEHWRLNESGTERAFAALLSGKSSQTNVASGIAWVIDSGSWCASTGTVQGGGVTAGHFSVTQVFRSPGSPASQSVSIVAHELGHTAGASHTHCTDRIPGGGLQPLDRCYNGEAGIGCYAGTPECPDESPDTDLGSSRGTLMSYCNFGPSAGAGCGSVLQEFHPAHEAILATRVATNLAAACLELEGGIDPADRIFENGFEDPS